MERAVIPQVLKSEPRFRLLFGSQVLSVLGDRVTSLALPFAVLATGGDLREVALVSAAQFVPFVLLALPAGVWADRWDRKRILMGSDVVRLLCQTVAAALLFSGQATPNQLVATAAVYGAADAFFAPAFAGLLPQTVSGANLQPANALRGLSYSASNVLGPALAGVLIAVSGPGAALAFDAATFAISICLLLPLRVGQNRRGYGDLSRLTVEPPLGAGAGGPSAAPAVIADPAELPQLEGRPDCQEPDERFWLSLRNGWGEVRTRSWLLAFLCAMSVYHLIVLPSVFVLGPVLMQHEYAGARSWALVTTAFGIGSVLGDVLFLRWQPRHAMAIAATSLLVASGQAAVIGSGLSIWLIAGLIGCCGVGVTGAFTLWTTSLGEHVPSRALSRVSSYDYLVTSGAIPLGNVLAGLAGAAFGLRATLIAMTLITATVCAGVASMRSVRTLPRGITDERC